jgi:hypothetical protein
MLQAVAVAIHTSQTGGYMDIFIRLPGFCIAVYDVNIGMTEITALPGHFSRDIEPNPVIVAENAFVVFNKGRSVFGIIRNERFSEIIIFGQTLC